MTSTALAFYQLRQVWVRGRLIGFDMQKAREIMFHYRLPRELTFCQDCVGSLLVMQRPLLLLLVLKRT
jgi:hypothetical protein